MIPAVAVALYEAHAALAEPSCHQALPPKVLRYRIVQSVHRLGRRAFRANVLHRRCLRLHAECELEGRDAVFQLGVGPAASYLPSRDIREHVEFQTLQVHSLAVTDKWEAGILRLDVAVAQRSALVRRWQEGRAEVICPALSQCLANGDIAGKVLVFRTQAVRQPRAHGRTDKRVAASVPFEHGAAMPGIGAMHRAHDRQIVDNTGHVGEEFADFGTALTVLLELKWRSDQVTGAARKRNDTRLGEGQRLAAVPVENRLRIERVNVRRAAEHEQHDDALGARREMRFAQRQRAGCGGIFGEQRGQRQPAKAGSHLLKSLPSRGSPCTETRLHRPNHCT